MKRKTLLTVVAIFGAIAAVFVQAFGLSPDFAAATAGIGAVLLYVFLEAKADIVRIRAQSGKFKDPKFLITIISAIIAALGSSGINLPISPEIIIAILTAIVGVLFKAKIATT